MAKGLLSDADRRSIRDAIRLVTDTFMVTPINYYIGYDSLDRWQEDRADKKFYSIVIDALKEDKIDDIVESLQGSSDEQTTQLTFNLEYLDEMGLCTTNHRVIFSSTKDYFNWKGIMYKVTDVYYDGPLDSKDVLVIVRGEKFQETQMTLNSDIITNGNQIPEDVYNLNYGS